MPPSAEPDAATPPPGIVTSRRTWVFVSALATMFMSGIEGTIVATAMPTIVGQLGQFELFSWVFTAYLLGQAVTIPIYGRLADLYGRKRILLIGIAGFLFGSVCCGLARSMLALVLFRLLQGIGAGAIMPVARTIIADIYQGAERARKQSYISIVFVVSAIVGPMIGAVLVAHGGWALVFWVNIPFGIVAGGLLAITLREQLQNREHRIDYLGSLLMMAGLGMLMLALVQASSLAAMVFWPLVVGGSAVLVLFLAHERRTAEPMLPLVVWRNPMVVGGNIANLTEGAIRMGVIAFLPAYMQGVLGSSAVVAGLALTVMSLGYSAGAFSSGRVMLRCSYRHAVGAGGVILVAGSAMMVALGPVSGLPWIFASVAVLGFGMGLNLTSYLVAVQSDVGWNERGIATSSMVFTGILGQSIGAAVFGGIVNAGLAGKVAGGGDIVDRLLDPALRRSLPPATIDAIMHAFAAALHNVYLINGLVALITLATVYWLPSGLRLVLAAPAPDRG